MTFHYGAAAYGEFTIFSVCVQIISILSVLGLDQYTLRQVSAKNEDVSLIGNSMLFSFISIGIFFPIFMMLNHFIGLIRSEYLIYAALSTVFLSQIRIIAEVLRAREKPALHALISNVLLSGISILLLCFFYFRNESWSIDLEIVYLLSMLLVFIAAMAAMAAKVKLNIDFSTIEHQLKQAFPFLLVGSIMILNEWVDKICLKTLKDNTEVGIYSLCYRLTQFVGFPLIAFTISLAPKVAQGFANGNAEAIKKTVHPLSRMALFFAVVSSLFLILGRQWILPFFGAEFSDGFLCLILLTIAQLFSVLCGPVGMIMKMTNGVKVFQWIILSSVILNVILNLILIPKYSINGAAFASLCSFILLNGWSALWIKRRMGFFAIY